MDFHFNVNDYVKVKLTEKGHHILRMNRNELNRKIRLRGGEGLGDYEPKVDEYGYTQFQLWVLMETFGPYISIGGDNCFETNIIACNGYPIKEEK